jgi:GntR family transcriptional regulator, transcriptional repressor for pyruvate dehydrogenase complex
MTLVPSTHKESKVYLEIVKQLRGLISQENLKPGDKLPSERELSERLNAGRSSVREALRALELLGLIETRRGEGTFIRDFRGNQLVQLLGAFVLQDDKAKKDVLETRNNIEMDCLRLAVSRRTEANLHSLRSQLQYGDINDEQFFYEIALIADNYLTLRIWQILYDYIKALDIKDPVSPIALYEELVIALENRSEVQLLNIYRKMRKMSF